MRHALALTLGGLVLVASLAPSDGAPLNVIVTHDLPNTGGKWQSGEVTVAAPPDEVQRWLTDYAAWPRRFPDIEWAQVVGTTPDGRRVVRFRSRLADRTMTLWFRDRPGLITYEGTGPSVSTRGKTFILDAGHGNTRIIMQSTAEVHGFLGWFASDGMKRERTYRKLRADLGSIVQLAHQWAAGARRRM